MSSIRVNPYPMPDLLAALEQLQRQQSNATLELATGSRINQPSDDPAGAAQLAKINDLSSQVVSFQRSISSISGQFSTAEAQVLDAGGKLIASGRGTYFTAPPKA